MSWRDTLWRLIDLVAPYPQPLSEAQRTLEAEQHAARARDCSTRIDALPGDPTQLQVYLQSTAQLMAEEQVRSSSVEARLTTIMGFASIAGTIVFGGIVAQLFSKTSAGSILQRTVAICGAIYLTLQLCVAVFASVKGLERRNYLHAAASDSLPQAGQVQTAYLRARMRLLCQMIDDHRVHTASKVTWMATAHRAALNFLGALLLIAVIAGYFVATHEDSAASELIDTLRTNRTLYEELRGPAGIAGPQGNSGNRGPPGEKGDSCRCEAGRTSSSSTPRVLQRSETAPKQDTTKSGANPTQKNNADRPAN